MPDANGNTTLIENILILMIVLTIVYLAGLLMMSVCSCMWLKGSTCWFL